MTGVCQKRIVLYRRIQEVNMIDKIIELLFTKKPKVKYAPKTVIASNRKEQDVERARAIYLDKIKNPESPETCLSRYFKNNKGLNYIERTTSLYVAKIGR